MHVPWTESWGRIGGFWRKTSQDSDSLYEIYSVFHMNLPNHRIQLSMLTACFCRQNYLTIISQHKLLYSKLTNSASNKALQLAAGSRSRPEAGAAAAEDQGWCDSEVADLVASMQASTQVGIRRTRTEVTRGNGIFCPGPSLCANLLGLRTDSTAWIAVNVHI